MGRRPWVGGGPVRRRRRGGHQRSCHAALWFRCHRRGAEPQRQPPAVGALRGVGHPLRPHEQPAGGLLGPCGGTPWRLLLQGQPDAERLRRLPRAGRQHPVLLLLDTPARPASAQHRRHRARRAPDGGVDQQREFPHGPHRQRCLRPQRFLCRRPRAGGAAVADRLRPFAARCEPALPVGEPPQGAEPHHLPVWVSVAGGQPGVAAQPARGALRTPLARLHAHAARQSGASLRQAHRQRLAGEKD